MRCELRGPAEVLHSSYCYRGKGFFILLCPHCNDLVAMSEEKSRGIEFETLRAMLSDLDYAVRIYHREHGGYGRVSEYMIDPEMNPLADHFYVHARTLYGLPSA